MLHGTQVYQDRVPCGIFSIKKSTSTQFFYETRVFKTRFTQQTRVVSKKCYIATYFANSCMLLIISAKSGKWPIWPKDRGEHYN